MTKVDGSSIGERIRMMRQAKSLTQEELASRAGLTKGFISQVERNLTSLSVESLLGILDALDQKASTFFDEGFHEKIVFGAEDRVELEREHGRSFRFSCLRRKTGSWTPRFSPWVPARRQKKKSPMKAKNSALSCREA